MQRCRIRSMQRCRIRRWQRRAVSLDTAVVAIEPAPGWTAAEAPTDHTASMPPAIRSQRGTARVTAASGEAVGEVLVPGGGGTRRGEPTRSYSLLSDWLLMISWLMTVVRKGCCYAQSGAYDARNAGLAVAAPIDHTQMVWRTLGKLNFMPRAGPIVSDLAGNAGGAPLAAAVSAK